MLPEKLRCKEFWSAIRDSNVGILESMCRGLVLPTFTDDDSKDHLLCNAMAKSTSVEVLKFFVANGVDPAAMPEDDASPLNEAIRFGRIDYLDFLLESGADPNADQMNQRLTLGAVSEDFEPTLQIEILRRLIAHGADLNFIFSLYDNMEKGFTVLDAATEEGGVADFLRQHGAKTAKELRAIQSGHIEPIKFANGVSISDEVVQHMEAKFGPVERKSFTDLLNAASGISVHVILAKSENGVHTLFTTGLSVHRMLLPKGALGTGYSEIYMQVPGSWDLLGKEGKYRWPIQLLSDLASMPLEHKVYFQIPITVISNGEPPEPLHPSVPFTSVALMGEEGLKSSTGQIINLFCVLPLYQAEAELARHSIPDFLKMLDRYEVGRVLDPKRSNCL